MATRHIGTCLALTWALAGIPACDKAPDCTHPRADQLACFSHQVFSHRFEEAHSGLASGAFETPSWTFAPIEVDPTYSHLLNFRMSPMMPPWRQPLATNGPLVLYSDDMDVLVFSPLDHFFSAWITFEDGAIRYGLAGEIDTIAAGHSRRYILVRGRGMAATLERWGDLLLADRGRQRIDPDADPGLARLSYWTDNGAFYYYNTAPGLNYEDTLLAVRDELKQRRIPVGALQIDSWWYYKAEGSPLGGSAGLTRWEAMPECFPDGLAAFQSRLGLPLIAHNRWFAPDNDYRDEFDFVDGPTMSLPTGRGVYDRFMADAAAWGIVTYEQDWLINQYWGVPFLRERLGAAESWYLGLAQAAADQGLTVQICMPGAAHLMAAVDAPNITSVRTSIDYQPDLSKESYWPQFHIANMLAWALGVWPYKDNFHSSETHGQAEALISALSGGPVGLGDGLGRFDRDVIMPTCREDGLLLKPDRPALPIDAMFLDHRRPFIVQTRSRHAGAGEWIYLAAFHLAREHPQRSEADRLHALISYDGQDLGDMFVFPDRVNNWRVGLESDLGLSGRRVAYDWRTGRATIVEGSFALPEAAELYDFDYLVLAPIAANGLALIGERDKFVTMAAARFEAVRALRDGFEIQLAGAPGEEVHILVFDARAGAMRPPTTITLDATGQAGALLGAD